MGETGERKKEITDKYLSVTDVFCTKKLSVAREKIKAKLTKEGQREDSEGHATRRYHNIREEESTVQLCGDSDVTQRSLEQNYRMRIGQVQTHYNHGRRVKYQSDFEDGKQLDRRT